MLAKGAPNLQRVAHVLYRNIILSSANHQWLDAAGDPRKSLSLTALAEGGEWSASEHKVAMNAWKKKQILGTPHAEPPEGLLRKIDQTRGLLKYVNSNYPGAAHPEMRYLSVGSTAVRGRSSTRWTVR